MPGRDILGNALSQHELEAGKFAQDSPLEEAVTSEPVSEVGVFGARE